MTKNPHYLIVDDDVTFALTLARSLHRRGLQASTAKNQAEALALCASALPDRVILDLKLEETSGLALIGQLQALSPTCHIVVLTGYSSIPTTVEAIKLGAINYLCKPASIDDIIAAFETIDGNEQTSLASTPHSIERLEWEHIQRILADNGGNISATARALGMHRRTLQRKLQKRPVKQ